MAAGATELEDDEILTQAKDRWEECDNHYSDMYEHLRQDWAFTHGDGQWDVGAKDVRSKDGRPCLVLNQLLPYAHQVCNDIKQARLAIRVVPVDSSADIDTAEIRAGIIRNIEKQSKAKDVYGTAAMNAIGAGLGWIRVKADYANNYSFEQEATIERVIDFTSIFLDPAFESIDGADANYGFVRINYTQDRFEELYPDAAPVSFIGGSSEEEINIVEYYYRECEKKILHEVEVEGETIQLLASRLKELDEMGVVYEKVRNREIDINSVYHCVLSGDEVLSKELIPCDCIPLVPVVGQEYFTNNKLEFHSLIRQAKDAQQMYNYWKSASTEFIALQPKAPYVGPVGSFQSYPEKWAAANTQNFPFLEYDVVVDENSGLPLPQPMRQPPITGSPAMMQEAAAAREDIRLALGMPQANMGERSNAVSGIAIRAQQLEGDNATFHFIDNLSSSIAQVGRILNEMIPTLYSERKVARIIGEDQQERNVPIGVPYIKDEDGERVLRQGEDADGIYDLETGKYDIDIDVGASYSSKRQETADKLNELMRIQPDLVGVVGDLAIEALDIPMSRQIAERIRAQMDPSVLGDDPQAIKLQEAAKAMKQLQEQLLNMEAALADKEKNKKFDQAAKAEEMQLDRDKFNVESEKTKADIAKIYADIQGDSQSDKDQALANISAVAAQVDDLTNAMELILGDMETDLEENLAASEPVESDETQNEETEE